jgi:hypothetical protein
MTQRVWLSSARKCMGSGCVGGSFQRWPSTSLIGVTFTLGYQQLSQRLLVSWRARINISLSMILFYFSSSENNMEAKFLGNAPCGHYKFKFPQAMSDRE